MNIKKEFNYASLGLLKLCCKILYKSLLLDRDKKEEMMV